MIAFLKTYEEANCTDSANCLFTFTDSLPEVTSMDAVFEPTMMSWTIKLTGTSFTGDSSNTELWINGIAQTTTTVSSTEAIFQVTSVNDLAIAQGAMKAYFNVGTPKGNTVV